MKRKRMMPFLTLVLASISGATLFTTSEAVQRTQRTLDTLQQKLVAEQENIHILQAEWSYLNRPDRLEQLAAQYLSLTPTETRRILTSLDVIREPFTLIPASKPAFAIPVALNKAPAVPELFTTKAVEPASRTSPPASFQNLVASLTSPELSGGTR